MTTIPRPPLERRSDDRWLGGVASAVARHVSVRPVVVRLAFVGLTAIGTFGILMYGALWIALAPVQPVAPARATTLRAWVQRVRTRDSILLAVAAAVVVVTGASFRLPAPWQLLAAGYGAAITWRQADLKRREHRESRRRSRARALLGSGLVVVAALGVLLQAGTISQLRQGFVSVIVVLVAAALVTGPWWLRTVQALGSERTERIRSQERAELAARVHDSVLQTLTLIQRHADDPKAVHRYARRQERNLRELLYRPASVEGRFTNMLERRAAEIEDLYGVTIGVVAVGDCVLDERTRALVDAAGEAMVNAAKSSGVETLALFAEVDASEVTVFVRDRGCGFDLDAVPPSRAGIRESIVGRMERAGGIATVRSTPGYGTEVQLSLGRAR